MTTTKEGILMHEMFLLKEHIERILERARQQQEENSKTLTFKRLREKNVARCEDVFHSLDTWSPNDWMTAVCGEVGEAANILKKLKRGDFESPIERAKALVDIEFELADAVIYIDLLAASLGITLEYAIINKFNVVSKKKGSEIKL